MKRHPLQWERPLWQYAPVAAMLAFQAWLTFRFWRRAKLDSLRLSAWMAVDCCALAVALCSTLLLAPTMVWFG